MGVEKYFRVHVQVGPALFEYANFEIEVYPNCSQKITLISVSCALKLKFVQNKGFLLGIIFSNSAWDIYLCSGTFATPTPTGAPYSEVKRKLTFALNLMQTVSIILIQALFVSMKSQPLVPMKSQPLVPVKFSFYCKVSCSPEMGHGKSYASVWRPSMDQNQFVMQIRIVTNRRQKYM